MSRNMDTTGVETALYTQKSTPAALPVTLLSGFLGSGKTTLLKRILENKEGLRVAVIVNDMASVNIDASLVSSAVIKTQEKLISLTNGCICCTLREDLLLELASLCAAEGSRFDVVVIESTGISEPMQVAETFTMSIPVEELRKAAKGRDGAGLRRLLESLPANNSSPLVPRTPVVKKPRHDEGNISHSKRDGRRGRKRGGEEAGGGGADEGTTDGERRREELGAEGEGAAGGVRGDDGDLCLSRWARLDTCVTVVDAARFWDDLHSIEDLSDRARSNGDAPPPDGDERTIAALLLDQIEFADVLILNKVDLVDPQASASSLPPPSVASGTRRSSRAAATESLVAALRKLNPRATIIPAKMCDVPLSAVIKTGRFDMEAAADAPGWLQSLRESAEDGSKKKAPETEEYGISSFVYRARRPFAPSRLYRNFLREFFITTVEMEAEEEEEVGEEEEDEEEEEDGEEEEDDGQERDGKQEKEGEKKHGEKGEAIANAADADETPANDKLELETRQRYERKRDRAVASQRSELGGTILRSKGFAWLANRDASCVELSAAGVLTSLSPGAPWFAELAESEWPLPAPRGTPEGDAAFAAIMADFAEGGGPGGRGVGDRRQEIVFIGQGVDESRVRRALDACLATDEEIELAEKGELSDVLFGEDEEEESEEE